MNWMSKLALLVGRKKFEDYAQANPTLPDDALAVANTLDTYPVRGAVTLIAGSLAHAIDNVLRDSETFEQLVTHALLILAGLCIIWVRHAISKHDVQVNDALQKVRTVAGITPAVKLIIAALLIGGWGQPLLQAQTNAAGETPLQLGTNVLSTAALFTQLVSDVGRSTKFSSGAGVNLTNLMISVSNNISLPGATLAVSATPSFIIVANTGVTYAVSNDMTSYFSSNTSNTAVTVSNLGPAQIFVGPGTFLEPALTLPPQVNLIGAGMNSTIITNTGTSFGITMTASNLLSDLSVTEPAVAAQAISVGYDCTLRRVKSYSPEDGLIGGSGNVWIDHCSVWSKGDCITVGSTWPGAIYIWDTDAHGIGPQDGYGQTARGNGWRCGGGGYAWNCVFEAGGNGWNAAVWSADNGVITNTAGVTNSIYLYNCTLIISNNANSVAISNDANCVVTEYGCNYDHAHVVGPVMHGIGPYTITINATSDSSGVVTGVYPAGKAILNANFFPTNAAGRYAFVNSFSGTNTATFTVYTNGTPCAGCIVVGPSTGYEQ